MSCTKKFIGQQYKNIEYYPMPKIAKLVTVSLVTRVIMEDSATDEQIMEVAKPRFVDKITTELGEHLESIDDDTECPYNANFDTVETGVNHTAE